MSELYTPEELYCHLQLGLLDRCFHCHRYVDLMRAAGGLAGADCESLEVLVIVLRLARQQWQVSLVFEIAGAAFCEA